MVWGDCKKTEMAASASPADATVAFRGEDGEPELMRCSKKRGDRQCKHWFPIADNRKQCEMCRASAKRRNHSDKGRDALRRFKKSDKGKACAKRSKHTEKGKATRKRGRDSETGKARERRYRTSEKRKACAKRYYDTEKGKATRKRQNDKLMNRLSTSLCQMIRGTHSNPMSFPSLGLFADNSDVQAHIESTFESWMTPSNQGMRRSDTLPNTVWQIGHRIPKVWFRHDDIAEVEKCWSRVNLKAQCAVENHNAKDRNILSREEWLALKPIWPKQCDKMTDEEAWVWARDDVDNTTRVIENGTEKVDPSAPNATFDTDSGSDSDSSSEDWF